MASYWLDARVRVLPETAPASTSTVRLAGSSGANPFACIAAGIAAKRYIFSPRLVRLRRKISEIKNQTIYLSDFLFLKINYCIV